MKIEKLKELFQILKKYKGRNVYINKKYKEFSIMIVTLEKPDYIFLTVSNDKVTINVYFHLSDFGKTKIEFPENLKIEDMEDYKKLFRNFLENIETIKRDIKRKVIKDILF